MRCNESVCLRVFFIGMLLALLATPFGWAQRPAPAGPAGGAADKVELLPPGADSLVVLNQPGQVVRKLFNNVRFRHKGVLMYCNLAIQNVTTNVIEAYGNVRIIQGDSISVRGDTMFYYGNNRQANLRGRVTMKDRKMTLTTARLDYDMLSGIAYYPVPGRIVDRENVLTSREGYYDTRTKQFTFRQNVRLVNPKYTLTADSLLYNSYTKIATFQGPTRIVSKDGTLLAKDGQYNTVTRVSNFQRRATVLTPKYKLTGDTLNFDNATELGIARGNVVLESLEEKGNAGRTIITGDHGRYNGKAGVTRVTGHAVVRSVTTSNPADTLYMRADTLFSFDNKEKKTRKLVGQKNVLIYRTDLQGKCDSLIYDVADSVIYFYKKPILWSQNRYQMEADTITARLKNNRINTMLMRSKAFVISQDTLLNFNQIKGRTITAYFKTTVVPAAPSAKPTTLAAKPTPSRSATPVRRPVTTSGVSTGAVSTGAVSTGAVSTGVASTTSGPAQEKTELDRVIVEGNGQSIYFAVDEKTKLVGMNRVECSKMNLEFKDRKVDRIRFYGRPDMAFVPPHEITAEKKALAGFRWRDTEKPTKAQTLWQADAPPAKPVSAPAARVPDKIVPLAKPSGAKAVLTSER